MALVHMTHPQHGALKVPTRAVRRYKKAGWRETEPKPEPKPETKPEPKG